MATYGSAPVDASVDAIRRRLAHVAPQLTLVGEPMPLELAADRDPPRTLDAVVMEAGDFEPRTVEGDPEVGFHAFLDGIQKTTVVAYAGVVPIVHGEVAAVVRERIDRRLVTWREPRRQSALFAPATALESKLVSAIGDALELIDISPADSDDPAPSHPVGWMERAVHFVQRSRERLEHGCALQWCDERPEALYIDGGIGGTDALARDSRAVGVVKTHRTLYVSGPSLAAVFALRPGERSPVFRISPLTRVPVLSWYLRLRDASGRDPMWGLVRVEIANRGDDISARADEISRWILAERTPLGMRRWDRMVYGIAGVEEYLRAL